VGDEHIVFFETAFIDQNFNAFAGSEFALGMLGVDPLFSATSSCLISPFVQLFDKPVMERDIRCAVAKCLGVIILVCGSSC